MFRWRRADEGGAETASDDAATAPTEHSCPGMARALERVLGGPGQPRILDLGQYCPSTAVYLADRGARVCVEGFTPPGHATRLVLDQPDRSFDLVLAWEHFDFLPPEQLAGFTAEVQRVLAPGGLLHLYARDGGASEDSRPDRPGSYRLTADDRVLRAQAKGPARPRWSYPNRAIERALSPLSVQRIHLRADRMREFLVQKSTGQV